MWGKVRFPLFTLALLLAACGPVPAQPPAESGTPAIKTGGALKLRFDRDPWDWDATISGISTSNEHGLMLAYSQLLGFKVGPGIRYNDMILEPELAERWEVSPDAKTYTFYLRKGTKFADLPPVNGRELTATDVKFSYEYASRTGALQDLKLPTSQSGWVFEGLESIDSPDPYTVTLRFKEGFAPFLNYAASKVNVIMAREIFDEDAHFKDRIVGTGPFQLDATTSQKGARWVFKKNPSYWETGKPYLDEIRFLVIGDDAAGLAAFQTKQLDQDYVQNAREADGVRRVAPDATFFEYFSPPYRIWLNQAKPPLNDVRVRKAISLALDRDAFIRVLAGGMGEWALAESDTWRELFTQEEIKSFVKFDVEEARRLLAQAGFPNGLDIETLFGSDQEEHATSLPLLQAQMKRAGINLVFRVMPYAQLSAVRRQRDFMLDTSAGSASRPDIDSRLMTSVYPKGGNNYQGIDDPKLTAMLLAQRREPDPAKRREIIKQAVRYIAEEFISTPTFRRAFYQYWHPYVKDFYPHADTPNRSSPGIARVWIDR